MRITTFHHPNTRTNDERKRRMKIARLLLIGLIAIFLAACNNESKQGAHDGNGGGLGNVGEFSAITQSGEEFNVTDLKGSWWVADFIFTNCTTVCLPMTANMAKLQQMLEDEGLDDVKLVSFSVDPDRDTPEVLTAYGEEYGADFNRWYFLTGYEFDEIMNYSVETFKNWVAPPPEGSDQVEHGTSFFLVDPEGNIVSHYSGTQSDQMQTIVDDLKKFQ